MKKFCVLAVAAIVVMGMAFTACDSKKSVSLKTEIDSMSYVLGSIQGFGLKQNMKAPGNPTFNYDVFLKGFNQTYAADTVETILGMDMQEVQNYLNNYFQTFQNRAMEENMKETEQFKIEAEKFLAENKSKSGVITTASGLQYQVIKEGKGAKPTAESEVKFNYELSLLDGTIKQTTFETGQPLTHPVSGVIEGFREALQLMSVGSRYKFWVPVELGYNQPGLELYNKLLIFDVELLEIVN